MPTQETIEKRIIGKRVVAIAWVPISGLDGLFVLGSVTLEGGARLEFGYELDQDCAVLARLTEDDHADA
jgi:hypothetical protein